MSKEKENNKQELNLEDLGGVNGGVAVYGMDQGSVKGESNFGQVEYAKNVNSQIPGDQNNVNGIVQNSAGIGITGGGGNGTGATGLAKDTMIIRD